MFCSNIGTMFSRNPQTFSIVLWYIKTITHSPWVSKNTVITSILKYSKNRILIESLLKEKIGGSLFSELPQVK